MNSVAPTYNGLHIEIEIEQGNHRAIHQTELGKHADGTGRRERVVGDGRAIRHGLRIFGVDVNGREVTDQASKQVNVTLLDRPTVGLVGLSDLSIFDIKTQAHIHFSFLFDR